MDSTSNFKSKKKDYIFEEKVQRFTGHHVSQHEVSTQMSEKSVSNEPTSSRVVKEDLFRSSKVLHEEEEGLDKYLANEISSKDVSRRILEDELLEHNAVKTLPLTGFQALKFQGRAKHFVGPRQTQRNGEIFLKTGEVKVAPLTIQNFHSAEGNHSTELDTMDKLLLFRSRGDPGNKETTSQRNRSEIRDLSWYLPPPAGNKKKDSETERNLKDIQQNIETSNEKFKMIVNNLATAVLYSFQNALTLQDQKNQAIDKSFLTFLLGREVRKMSLIKELIKELKAITCNFRFHEEDFKDISETVESLHSLMREDLKDSSNGEISHEGQKYYPGFIAMFAIIARIIAVIGLAVVFLGKWSGLLVFPFLVLVLLLVIRPFLK